MEHGVVEVNCFQQFIDQLSFNQLFEFLGTALHQERGGERCALGCAGGRGLRSRLLERSIMVRIGFNEQLAFCLGLCIFESVQVKVVFGREFG
jgi:hypothetical protein